MKTFQSILVFTFLIATLCIQAQNKPFEVTIKGQGQPVLLFPGFTCTGSVWEDTVVELSKNYECHIFTFAGFGEVAAIEKPWLPKIKEGVNTYVKENQLKAPMIIGHSLGGALGLWLTSEKDHPYSKLIVVDALPSTGALMMPNFNSENIVYESPWNKQTLEMNDEAFDAMATQMSAGMTMNTEKQNQIKEWIIQSDRETYVYGYTDLLKLDLREDIAQIKIPVTILAATHPYGLEMAKNTYEGQYKNLEDYEIEFAEGAAHFIMYDKPEWFKSKILKHIK
jgi:pimeloyl-ACP methyl ester carboxylesterase